MNYADHGYQHRGLWVWLGILCSLWLANCTASNRQKACFADDVCDMGQYCDKDRLCKTGCSSDARCPQGQSCFNKQCAAVVCGSRANPPTAEETDCYTGENRHLQVSATECKAGRRLCLRNGQAWSPCYGEQQPRDEICDQLDNNCNGQIDEGLDCRCSAGIWRICHSSPPGTRWYPDDPLSLCRQGVQYCQSTGIWGNCLGQIKPHQSPKQLQECMDLDGNCDGRIDSTEHCQCSNKGEVRDCYTGPSGTQGVGNCQKGRQTCIERCRVEGQTPCPAGDLVLQWSACEGQILPIREEIKGCNRQDDDCDGQIDNQCEP